jgi:hypothetical protein
MNTIESNSTALSKEIYDLRQKGRVLSAQEADHFLELFEEARMALHVIAFGIYSKKRSGDQALRGVDFDKDK